MKFAILQIKAVHNANTLVILSFGISMLDKNKKFGIFGLGLSGLATIKYLSHHGVNFIAFDDQATTITKITENYPELSKYLRDLSDIAWQNLDYLILSPGIPLTYPDPHKVVKLASNAKIICDIELFYLNNKDKFFIGITGTNGKSTTSSLINHILQYNKLPTIIAGNIGIPILSTSDKNYQYCVIEVSSFQLDLLDKTKFNYALLLNISPDHLDRHGNMENYTNSKYKIFAHQDESDYAIINDELNKDKLQNQHILSFSNTHRKTNTVSVIDNTLFYNEKTYLLPINNSLLGKHNQQNIAAACSVCLAVGLSFEQIIASLPSFVGLKHRMQYLGMYNNITFINDSKATNADSTEKALASFDNIIWIAGGTPKAGGIEPLSSYFPKIKQTLLIGKAQDEFADTCGNLVSWQKCDNLANAFSIACKIAEPGDVVLLSPACASYDQWKNFEERGEAFIKLVSSLASF